MKCRKILWCLVIVCMILCACINTNVINNANANEEKIENKNEEVENETKVDMTKTYPLVYGSTSLIPFMAKLKSKYTGEDIKKVEQDIIKYNNTLTAWNHIEYNREYTMADMIFVYELYGNVDSRMHGIDETYEYVEIANDALAFVVNDKNKINNINEEDIKKIYKEEITNWKELGGDDEDILYFKNESGDASEILFKKYVLDDVEYIDSIDAVDKDNEGYINYTKAVFDNASNAIGFATYNYLENMLNYKKHNMKILSVNGVMPNYDTIKNKTYPYVGKIYAVMRKNEQEDSEARKLLEYIKSDEGKKIIKECGMVEVDDKKMKLEN